MSTKIKKIKQNKTRQYTVSSLEKIFPFETPKLKQTENTMFRNEKFHFQVACYTKQFAIDVKYEIISDIKEYITLRTVELVPSRFAKYPKMHDSYVLKGHGNNEMYPDLLREFYLDGGETMRPREWSTFWVTIDGRKGVPVGRHKISIRIYGDQYHVYDRTSDFYIEVLDEQLPKSDLLQTYWLHYDCIAEQHGQEPFSEAYNTFLEKYIEAAVGHGINTTYVPLFTPPLDTGRNVYRRKVQLLDIKKQGNEYIFDFSKAKAFVRLCQKMGVEYFELPHLTTQWGAQNCPQIWANVDGQEKRIFGWETSAVSKEYLNFLEKYLQELKKFIEELAIYEKVLFHISDEPPTKAVENYKVVLGLVRQYFPDAKLFDAISRKEFYTECGIKKAVISISEYKDLKSDYVYYCGADRLNFVPNRQFVMPSQRARIYGFQFFKNDIKGFLNWAFNFYNTTLSYRPINPYQITDANGYFISGGCSVVYPKKDGVDYSLRFEVLYDGLQDYLAMKKLAELIGENKAKAYLEKNGVKSGFSNYPRSAKWHILFRKKLNRKIMECKENK